MTMAAIGAASALFGSSGGSSSPPPAAPPVVTPLAAARDPNADVKIGDGTKPTDNAGIPSYTGFTEKRLSGSALGGLGRSGLGL